MIGVLVVDDHELVRRGLLTEASCKSIRTQAALWAVRERLVKVESGPQ